MRPVALENLMCRLAPQFGERLIDLREAPEQQRRVNQDASHAPPGDGAALVLPKSTAEVSAVAAAAQEFGVPMVPRGAGTGKAGACIPATGNLVVDLGGMRQLLSLRPADQFAVVQPGLITEQLDLAAGAAGLMYPPDPASWSTCSLGGNIATNAGGPRAVKYGVTARYVWGLEVVLAGGEVVRMGRQCLKGVAGLAMAPLWVGSEGTLGLITEATLHLVPAPRGVQTAWLSFASPAAASAAGSRIFAGGIMPRMLELLDDPALTAVRPAVGWPMPTSAAALLVETDAHDMEAARRQMERLCELAAPDGAQLASDGATAEAMRQTRRLVSSSLKALYPQKVSDDIAVPRSRMPDLLEQAQACSRAAGIGASAYGHMGDGNLHVNFLCRTVEERQRTVEVRQALYRWAVAQGGTVSGEHGLGLTKRAALDIEFRPESLRLQRRIKKLFDPHNLLNPGKSYAE
jgi:glycolate oxidase